MSTRQKNVLHICSWYPNRVTGLDGNFIHKHIRSVSQYTNSHGICVIKDRNMDRPYEPISTEEDEVPVTLVYFKAGKFRIVTLFRRFIAYIKAYRIAVAKLDQIDLIHAHVILDAGVFAFLLSIWHRCPFFMTEHSIDYIQPTQNTNLKYFLPIIRLISKRSTGMFPVSKNLKENMRLKKISGRYHVLGNVVNSDLFSLKENRTTVLRFLHISTFNWYKNTEGILDALKVISNKRTDFSITLAGDGDIEKIKAYAKKIDLSTSVCNFHGALTEEDVAEFMKKHDCFILFSHFENLPCVLLEAQMCGLPVIATDVGGVKEIIDESALGIVIQPADKQALIKAMNYILDNYAGFSSDYIRNKALQRYSESKIGEQLLELYNEF